MFGRLNLMKDGAQAEGVVLESEERFGRVSGPGEMSVGATIMQLQLRVQFDDGTTTEVERKLKDTDYGGRPLQQGDTVPMRYNPKDRSQIEIDKAAMKAKYREEAEKSGAQAERLTDLQGARKRGEISGEEFTKLAEQELDL